MVTVRSYSMDGIVRRSPKLLGHKESVGKAPDAQRMHHVLSLVEKAIPLGYDIKLSNIVDIHTELTGRKASFTDIIESLPS